MYQKKKKGFSPEQKAQWLQDKFGGTYWDPVEKTEIYVVGFQGSLHLAKDDGTPICPPVKIHSDKLKKWIKTSDEPTEYKFPNWCV